MAELTSRQIRNLRFNLSILSMRWMPEVPAAERIAAAVKVTNAELPKETPINALDPAIAAIDAEVAQNPRKVFRNHLLRRAVIDTSIVAGAAAAVTGGILLAGRLLGLDGEDVADTLGDTATAATEAVETVSAFVSRFV